MTAGATICAAREEILGRCGVRVPCQDGVARGPGDGDRKALPHQLGAPLVEELPVAARGLPGVQAFRDLSGGSQLFGLAELGNGRVDLGSIDAPSGQLCRQGSGASNRAPSANKRAREGLIVEVAKL